MIYPCSLHLRYKRDTLKLGLGMINPLTSLKSLIVSEKKENSLFCVYDPLGVKILTRLRP